MERKQRGVVSQEHAERAAVHSFMQLLGKSSLSGDH